MPENIVLIGYRCTGKTSIAKIIGKKLGWKIISTDKEIIKRIGSIARYVKKYRWNRFRDVESKVINGLKSKNIVIDCGGGVVVRWTNIKPLKKNGKIFWLKASVNTIKKRFKKSYKRPSLSVKKSSIGEIKEILNKRIPLYRKAADYEIITDNKNPKEIAEEILNIILKNKKYPKKIK